MRFLRPIVFLPILATALRLSVNGTPAAEPVWNIRNLPMERVSVIAHRGAGFLAPENTMGALELSWSMGCIPELDVRTTKDGHVMMFHDANFARILPDATEEMKKRRLEDLTYDEAKQLDIGSFRGPQFAGQRIVSLAEIVAALKQDARRQAYLDVKKVDLAVMARETAAVPEQVILATGSEADCARWKELAPRSDTFLWVGTWNDTNDVNVEKRFAKLRASGFAHINHLQVHCHFNTNTGAMVPSDDFIRRAATEVRLRGIEFQTMPWNVPEKPEAYVRLLDLGSGALGTDRPDVAMSTLRAYYQNGPATWNVRDHFSLAEFIVQAHRATDDLSVENLASDWKLGCVPAVHLRTAQDGAIVASQASTGKKTLRLSELVALLQTQRKRSLYLQADGVELPRLAPETTGVHPQIILSSTAYESLRQWRRIVPKSSTLLRLDGPVEALAKQLQTLRSVNFTAIDQLQVNVRLAADGTLSPSEAFLRETGRELRTYGILFQVLPAKANDPDVWRRLLDLGSASLATEHPAATLKTLHAYYAEGGGRK